MTFPGGAIIDDHGPVMQPLSLDNGTGNSWGDFKINPSGSFTPGNNVATPTFAPTGEVAMAEFTVK